MSAAATAATSAYWRAAGMTYLKYANLCAEVLRGSLKEPFLGKAKARETVYFKQTPFADGKAGKAVITEVVSQIK